MTPQINEPAAITQPELAAAIEGATREVFSTMLNLNLVAGSVFVEKERKTPASGVVSLIGLAGAWVGTGSLSCSTALACKIASHFLMAEYDAVGEDVLDSVAEVTNMIIGNVKTMLENRLGGMGLSTPTVIYGLNFQTRSTRNREWTVVPFDCQGERLCVQVCIVPNTAAGEKTVRSGFPVPHMLNV
jgi:chemotaxis protein CheX